MDDNRNFVAAGIHFNDVDGLGGKGLQERKENIGRGAVASWHHHDQAHQISDRLGVWLGGAVYVGLVARRTSSKIVLSGSCCAASCVSRVSGQSSPNGFRSWPSGSPLSTPMQLSAWKNGRMSMGGHRMLCPYGAYLLPKKFCG